MELHQLKYFVAVAESGSVTRAAQRCHVAQPSLSQQIQRLEASLRVRLLDRLGRGVALTDAGRALLPRARTILAEVRDAEAGVRADAEAGAALLSVGAIPTVAPYMLPAAIERIRRETPTCEIKLREGLTEELIESVIGNEIDCALVSTIDPHELIEQRILAYDELCVVAALDDRLAGKGSVTWARLRDRPIITLHEMHCLGMQIQSFCAARSAINRIVCRATQLSTIFELVGLGLGLSLVPAMAAAAHGTQRWRYLRFRQQTPQRPISIIRRKGRTQPRITRRFEAIVAETLAESQGKSGRIQKRDSTATANTLPHGS